jgi:hypothetical protein
MACKLQCVVVCFQATYSRLSGAICFVTAEHASFAEDSPSACVCQ